MTAKRATKKTPALGHRTRVGRERRARTEARIIAGALRVFADKGTDAPVIDDFIREAGVARGTFYNYFTRTEQLLIAVSRSLEDDVIQSIEEAMSGLNDPVARLATGIRLWLKWSRADPVWCAFIVRSRFRGRLVERQVTADLNGGRRAGEFSFPNIEIARDLVVGTVLEAMHRTMTGRVSSSYADGVTRAVLRGLGLDGRSIDAVMSQPVPAMGRPVRALR